MEDRLIRVKELAQILSVSRSKIWDDVAKGKFPKPFKLSEKTTVWKMSAIQAHLESLGG